jgi:hypothetical protein|tara:strand:- start:1324 stop:1509 length:186 start_codon:yes stop_codon:yes gene_type:complete
MKNRDYINRQLDNLEGVLGNLRGIVSKQEPLETYLKGIERAGELIEEIRSQIENEPMGAHE